MGGYSSGPALLDSAELYDPTSGNWSATGSLTTPRSGHTATLLPSGKVLVVGGGPLGSDVAGMAELYDPATGSWTETGSLNTPRGAFTATLLDTGKVLVAGGVDNSDATLSSAELYDPTTETWSYTGDLVSGRLFHTATRLQDGRVLVVGGWGDDFFGLSIATAELYDPAAGTWSNAARLNQARSFHTSTALQDGRVLVAGGYLVKLVVYAGSPGVFHVPASLDEAEIFDPIGGTWATVASLNGAREGHTATLLPDGEVLIAGGFDWSVRLDTSDTQLYEPVSAAWSEDGSLGSARHGHTATLLRDGTVLVAGGAVVNDSLASAELYIGTGCQ